MIGITGSTGVVGKILQKNLKSKKIKFSNFKGNIMNQKTYHLGCKKINMML